MQWGVYLTMRPKNDKLKIPHDTNIVTVTQQLYTKQAKLKGMEGITLLGMIKTASKPESFQIKAEAETLPAEKQEEYFQNHPKACLPNVD